MVRSSSGVVNLAQTLDQAADAVPFGKRSRRRGADGAEMGSLVPQRDNVRGRCGRQTMP
jgi:hypothetical protein